MNKKDWLILKALYEEMNITNAAKKLYISQPALSYRIKELENDMGVKIIIRSNRGVEFTEEGEYIVQYAMNMITEFRKMKDYVQSMASDRAGIIRLGVAANFSRHILPDILQLFANKHPNVQYNLYTGLSTIIRKKLYDNKIYIGIVRGPANWESAQIKLMEEDMVIISKDPINMERLPLLPRILYKTSTTLQTSIDDWWKENYSIPPHTTMVVDNIETAKKLVSKGLGYSIVPNMNLTSLTDNSKIYPIKNKSGQRVVRETYLIYKESSLDLEIIRKFIDFVKDYFDRPI